MNKGMEEQIEEFINTRLEPYDRIINYYRNEGNQDAIREIHDIIFEYKHCDKIDLLNYFIYDEFNIIESDFIKRDQSSTLYILRKYPLKNLFGYHPRYFYNFASLYFDLSNDNETNDKVNEVFDYMLRGYNKRNRNNIEKNEFIKNVKFNDFALSCYSSSNYKETMIENDDDIRYIFDNGVQEYISEHYNEIINDNQFIKDIIDDIQFEKDYEQIADDSFSENDWGF